jgi:hypothetical protein
LTLDRAPTFDAVASPLYQISAVTYANFGRRGYERLMENIQCLMTRAVSGLGLALPVLLLAVGFSRVDQSANTEARDKWQAILAQLSPPGQCSSATTGTR